MTEVLTNDLLRIKLVTFQIIILLIYDLVFDSLDSRFLDKTLILMQVDLQLSLTLIMTLLAPLHSLPP